MRTPRASWSRICCRAGFEIDNPRLVHSADLAAFGWLGETEIAHSEFRDDRFVAAFDRNRRAATTLILARLCGARRDARHLCRCRRRRSRTCTGRELSARTATGFMQVHGGAVMPAAASNWRRHCGGADRRRCWRGRRAVRAGPARQGLSATAGRAADPVARGARPATALPLSLYANEAGRWRLKTDIDRVDPQFLKMLVAYEDKRFHEHHGVDPLAIAAGGRAVPRATARIVSGGST